MAPPPSPPNLLVNEERSQESLSLPNLQINKNEAKQRRVTPAVVRAPLHIALHILDVLMHGASLYHNCMTYGEGRRWSGLYSLRLELGSPPKGPSAASTNTKNVRKVHDFGPMLVT